MKSILVRVVDGYGNARSHEDVTVWQSGFFGNCLSKGRTDSSGAAEFILDINDSARIDIHIAGKVVAQEQRLQANYRFVT